MGRGRKHILDGMTSYFPNTKPPFFEHRRPQSSGHGREIPLHQLSITKLWSGEVLPEAGAPKYFRMANESRLVAKLDSC